MMPPTTNRLNGTNPLSASGRVEVVVAMGWA